MNTTDATAVATRRLDGKPETVAEARLHGGVS